MPRDTAVLGSKILIIFPGVIIPMNEMDLRVPFRSPASGMDMVSPKIASEIESLLDRQVCEVLISECDDFALSNEESKLIFSSGSQLAQLNTCNFRSDGGGELFNLRSCWKKIFEGRVRVFAMIDVCERLERWVFFAMVPDGQIVWILCSLNLHQLSLLRIVVQWYPTVAVDFPPSSSMMRLTLGWFAFA